MNIYLNDDIEHFDWQAALPQLSEQRREQCLKFRHELGRQTCAAAYLLLCEALRKEYGITEKPVFEYGEHGKPVISGHPDIHFNMSHCREAAICVVSDQPVGVDIESIHRYSESLALYVMSDKEMEQILHAVDPQGGCRQAQWLRHQQRHEARARRSALRDRNGARPREKLCIFNNALKQ